MTSLITTLVTGNKPYAGRELALSNSILLRIMAKEISYKESICKQLADGFFSTTEHFCLVPEQLYQEENKDLWLNFGQETITKQQEINTQYLPQHACYFLWENEQNKPHIVPALLNAEFPTTSHIISTLHQKQITIVLLLQGKIQVATTHPTQTKDDILYHLLNIYTQWKLDTNTLPTYLIGIDENTTAFINEYIAVQ